MSANIQDQNITQKPEMHNYLVKGFPLKSATWRVVQYEMLSGSSIMSVKKRGNRMNPLTTIKPLLYSKHWLSTET